MIADDKRQGHVTPVQHLFARMLKIYRDFVTQPRLHLTKAPFRGNRIAHDHAGFEDTIHYHLAGLSHDI